MRCYTDKEDIIFTRDDEQSALECNSVPSLYETVDTNPITHAALVNCSGYTGPPTTPAPTTPAPTTSGEAGHLDGATVGTIVIVSLIGMTLVVGAIAVKLEV